MLSGDLKPIRGLDAAEISDMSGLPLYRGKQILGWVSKGVVSFDQMLNIPKTIRESLTKIFYLDNYEIVVKQVSSQDGTVKVLGKLIDGNEVESVLMKYKYGYSACVSTQVGCKMGCTFCASAVGGFVRNLTAGEMLGEVYTLTSIAETKLSNIVLMGSGEPLDNINEVLKFIEKLIDPQFYGISGRSITLSTSGMVEEINALASMKLPITLAVSLHNPFDDERQVIMPIARKYTNSELIEAAHNYYKSTGRRVTYEYALIEKENDSIRHAQELSRLLKNRSAHVNLIPMNPVQSSSFKGSDQSRVRVFQDMLSKSKINSTLRRELGSDIKAACGQLKNNYRRGNG